MTNYLLPLLGLAAQLPHETSTKFGEFESFCLAVGSPMLITFSLMSTAMHARTTSKMFADKFYDDDKTLHLREAMKSAEYFLCGSQQCPIRIDEDKFRKLFDGSPGQLGDQWRPLKTRLHRTRRRYTPSLSAQTFLSMVAWILTIVGSYVTSLSGLDEYVQLSSGTLWTWLVPVVLGWMAVGVQSGKDTVQAAIQGEAPGQFQALEARSGFLRSSTGVHDAFCAKVQGDEASQGPIYNYARILTNPRLRDMVVRAFERKCKSLQDQELQWLPVRPGRQGFAHVSAIGSTSSGSPPVPAGHKLPIRTGTSERQADPDFDLFEPYMRLTDVTASSDWMWNFVVSNTIALLLQWSFTGSAMVVSYLMEVRSLGCRFGSYLL
jgi:hypothetical protein